MLGLNGCGKSTLLTAIGCRELPIPDHMDIYHLTREIEASDMSALQAVVSCDEEDRDRNREEAMLVLAEAGRSLENLPADLSGAIKAGRVPVSIVKRFFELEKSAVFRWLLNFGGFKERLLADDLFLAKVGIECGVGIFTKVRYN